MCFSLSQDTWVTQRVRHRSFYTLKNKEFYLDNGVHYIQVGDTTLIKMDNTELVEENVMVGVTFQTGTKRYFPY